jgi:hypothetical protein
LEAGKARFDVAFCPLQRTRDAMAHAAQAGWSGKVLVKGAGMNRATPLKQSLQRRLRALGGNDASVKHQPTTCLAIRKLVSSRHV